MSKFKTSLFTTLLVFIAFSNLYAQNLFPKMVDSCHAQNHSFCLDCGDTKAAYDSLTFAEISKKVAVDYNIKGAHGGIAFQVLVDSIGNGCVISHTDVKDNPITRDIVKSLNAGKWVPAKTGKKAEWSSIVVVFKFADGTVTGSIQRVDNEKMTANMRNPGKPTIYNKDYKYINPSLKSYDIKVWQKENSDLPNDMGQHCAVDKSNTVWYATFGGLVRFDGQHFTKLTAANSPLPDKQEVYQMAVDNSDNKWFSTVNAIYKFDNTKWEKYDSTRVGVKSVYNIVATNNNEILFCDDKGLFIYKDGKYEVINQQKVNELPSNRVDYAYRDKQNRLWIGTFSGSIMISPDGKVTSFNKSETPVNGTCITAMTEDAGGNVYFALYDYSSSKSRDRDKEGIAKLAPDGAWTHYNDKNSGLPANHINNMFYDKFENLLWLGTNSAGLVRFDLNNGWEMYNNDNSDVPSCYIYAISQDSNGALYVSTYNGMMRIKKSN
jgi:hypothetical protein